MSKKFYSEAELAAVAKAFRERSGKTKAALARELGVGRASMQDAEEHPERSMTSLRGRIIEACSPYKLRGPVYFLERQ